MGRNGLLGTNGLKCLKCDSQSVAFQRDGGAAVCRNSEFWLQLLLLSWQIAKSANGGPATRLQMVSVTMVR